MGDALADNRPDGGANGREWRTTPLWGLRLMRQFLNGQAFLMHDGRARTIEDAILLHGGEAKRARDAFAALTPPIARPDRLRGVAMMYLRSARVSSSPAPPRSRSCLLPALRVAGHATRARRRPLRLALASIRSSPDRRRRSV